MHQGWQIAPLTPSPENVPVAAVPIGSACVSSMQPPPSKNPSASVPASVRGPPPPLAEVPPDPSTAGRYYWRRSRASRRRRRSPAGSRRPGGHHRRARPSLLRTRRSISITASASKSGVLASAPPFVGKRASPILASDRREARDNLMALTEFSQLRPLRL